MNRMTSLSLAVLMIAVATFGSSVQKNPTVRGISHTIECKLCSFAVEHMPESEKGLDRVASLICNVGPVLAHMDKEECIDFIKTYRNEAYKISGQFSNKPGYMCNILLKIKCTDLAWPYPKWILKIPPVPKGQNVARDPWPRKTTSTTNLKILHITDIHMDLKYTEGSYSVCNKPICCRADSKKKGDALPAKKYGMDAKCDLPLATFEDFLEQQSKLKYDAIYWTGDLPPHNPWNDTKEESVNEYNLLVKLFAKYFKATPIYFAIGNHESAPVDSFPDSEVLVKYPEVNNQWLYDMMASLWKTKLPAAKLDAKAYRSIKKGGYYTILFKKGLRIVSLNNNFCDFLNWWLLIHSEDPNSQLSWLINVLREAEKAGERVHILGHIPPGSTDCIKWWSYNFYNIITRYSHIVTAQFYGHTHMDSYEVFYDDGQSNREETMFSKMMDAFPRVKNLFKRVYSSKYEAVNVAYIAPSLTPYQDWSDGLSANPAYRTYDVDQKTFYVTDHHTYLLPLASINNDIETPLPWTREYGALSDYNMTNLSPESWHNLTTRLVRDNALFDEVYEHFYKTTQHGVKCDEQCRKRFICDLVSGKSYVEYNDWCQEILPQLNNSDGIMDLIYSVEAN